MLKSKLVLAASLAFAVTGAFADASDPHINDWSTFGSTTYEQVKQEMRDAYARGDRDMGEAGYFVAQSPSTTRSRAEVLAELREATRLGLISVGESDPPIATAEQERLIAKAGHDAAEQFAKSADVEG